MGTELPEVNLKVRDGPEDPKVDGLALRDAGIIRESSHNGREVPDTTDLITRTSWRQSCPMSSHLYGVPRTAP